MEDPIKDIARGERFAFGNNWRRFLGSLSEERIRLAEDSLRGFLGRDTLAGAGFLDVGSGSGLFSLAARRLGAKVHSFDFDPASVACTASLRSRFFPDDPDWTVERGSALDDAYLAGLGRFSIVYSWGVLHHTGSMWQALANVAPLVRDDGTLLVSIYNDQGKTSRRWHTVKRLYNRMPRFLRGFLLVPAYLRLFGWPILAHTLKGRPLGFFRAYREASRGMSPWHDLVDWVGGYPFEVARPEEIFSFFHERGFALANLKTCLGSHGCNEYVFRKQCSAASAA